MNNKIILLLITLLFSSFSNATLNLDVSRSDHVRHIQGTGVISLITNQVLYAKTELTTKERVGYSMASGLVVGMLKEIKDSREKNNHFCIGDMKANLLGAIIRNYSV